MFDIKIWAALGGAALLALVGCGDLSVAPASETRPPATPQISRLEIGVPSAWGGETRCAPATGCRMAVVDHGAGRLLLYGFEGRKARLLDQQRLAYHPDSAKWLDDDRVVAAVEQNMALEVFRVVGGKLTREAQLEVGFAPRDVVRVESSSQRYTLLAAPYDGKEVAFVDWIAGAGQPVVKKAQWCQTPWHPVLVAHAPGAAQGGIAAACWGGKEVVFAPVGDGSARPVVLARFDARPRQAQPSPSGRWLYVALETGGRTARIDMQDGQVQYLAVPAPEDGAVAALPLDDDRVIWGSNNSIFLQRYDGAGQVLETRWLRPGGFPTLLQWIDVDGDGQPDLVVYNSSGKTVDVFFGPVWEQAGKERSR